MVGSLTFADATWLFEGKKRNIAQLPFTPEEVGGVFDALVLTQGLDDHAHIPTLKRIPKSIKIIANPQAAEICRSLGFTDIETIKPGGSTTVKDVEIQAFRGSLVGPPWSEPQNGYCFKYGEFRVVTEPHGNLPTLGYQADVLIMPVVSQSIGPYPLVNGVREAVDAARQLRPRLFVPLENGEIDSSGVLSAILSEGGTIEAFAAECKASGLPTEVKRMLPYQPLALKEEAIAMTAVTGEVAANPIEKLQKDFQDFLAPFTAKSKAQQLKRDLLKKVAPLRCGAAMTKAEEAEVLAIVEELKPLNPTPATSASPLINGRWDLLWTTEKEQLFFVEKGLFGSGFVAAKQDIDVASGRLQNLIEFEKGDYFKVSSSLSSEPPVRCNFVFGSCVCKRGPLEVPLPPVGKGWFDTVYLDDTLRIAEDIRGDTLIVARERGAEPFTVPESEN
jgi:L-ascorbate metabolism protein UlaG (beta-lactamase superfamily)